MERALMEKLVAWKDSSRRKPLILNGARQVGKTWLLKEFGRLHFENVAYVSLDNDSLARGYFESGFDIARIIASLALELDMKIQPGETLIVLDEAVSTYRYQMLDREKLISLLKTEGQSREIVLTGRKPMDELVDIADYVTEMKKIKHPFDGGLTARKGIEY